MTAKNKKIKSPYLNGLEKMTGGERGQSQRTNSGHQKHPRYNDFDFELKTYAHNAYSPYGMDRVSPGRFICKTKALSTNSLSLYG